MAAVVPAAVGGHQGGATPAGRVVGQAAAIAVGTLDGRGEDRAAAGQAAVDRVAVIARAVRVALPAPALVEVMQAVHDHLVAHQDSPHAATADRIIMAAATAEVLTGMGMAILAVTAATADTTGTAAMGATINTGATVGTGATGGRTIAPMGILITVHTGIHTHTIVRTHDTRLASVSIPRRGTTRIRTPQDRTTTLSRTTTIRTTMMARTVRITTTRTPMTATQVIHTRARHTRETRSIMTTPVPLTRARPHMRASNTA